jgi:tetratricopeptide (TPR) repeat protein
MTHQPEDDRMAFDVSRRRWLDWIRAVPWNNVSGIAFVVAIVSIWLLVPAKDQAPGQPWWGTATLICLWILLQLFYRFVYYRWFYLAQRPAKEWARGRREAANRAYQKARAYAQKLPKSDSRRGVMLDALANYLANCGRRKEAAALFEECIALLENCAPKWKLNFFNALNDFGTFHFYARYFKSAQRLYELALDTLPSLKKVDQPNFDTDMETILFLNLIALFLQMNCLPEAENLLDDVDPLIAKASRANRKTFADMALARRCLLHFARGDYDSVERDADRAYNPKMVAQARYKVLLARGKFTEAEAMIRETMQAANTPPDVRYPWNLEPLLDLAEAQYGQGKHDGAFGSFEEARNMVAEFALPPDTLWRTALATWAARARTLGRSDLAAVLGAELTTATAIPDQAITILDRFRVRTEESADTP